MEQQGEDPATTRQWEQQKHVAAAEQRQRTEDEQDTEEWEQAKGD